MGFESTCINTLRLLMLYYVPKENSLNRDVLRVVRLTASSL